jgi:hypothetical protein
MRAADGNSDDLCTGVSARAIYGAVPGKAHCVPRARPRALGLYVACVLVAAVRARSALVDYCATMTPRSPARSIAAWTRPSALAWAT